MITALTGYPFALRVATFIACVCLKSANAQNLEINFTDLKRPGKPAIKTITIPGLAERAESMIRSFEGSDSNERAEIARRRAEYATLSAPTESSAKPERNIAAAPSMWICSIYCRSASGPVVYREVSANSRKEAAKKIEENAFSICKVSGHGYESRHAYDESQCSKK